jgi:hypothetical protein
VTTISVADVVSDLPDPESSPPGNALQPLISGMLTPISAKRQIALTVPLQVRPIG